MGQMRNIAPDLMREPFILVHGSMSSGIEIHWTKKHTLGNSAKDVEMRKRSGSGSPR